jgi:hypothetical protein
MCVSLRNVTTRWENIIKVVDCEGCGWTKLAEDRVHFFEYDNETFGSITTRSL